jgi:hypothetical protein
MVKHRERKFITSMGSCRKKVFQPIFSKQTFALGLNRRKNGGKERGESPSHRCVQVVTEGNK